MATSPAERGSPTLEEQERSDGRSRGRGRLFLPDEWGHHDEFLELFTRNHLPVLHEQVKSGRMLEVRVQVPRFHGDGRADWDVMVTIVFRDWAAIEGHSDRKIIERLYPDRPVTARRSGDALTSSMATGTSRSNRYRAGGTYRAL